jgi:hypothetical protein
MLGFGHGDEASVGQHHVGLQQIVNGQTILATQVTMTAAERQAA